MVMEAMDDALTFFFDESTGTIGKRFASINVENVEENSSALRELLFTAPGVLPWEITECTSRYQPIIPDFRSDDSKNDPAKQASGYMLGGKRLPPKNVHKPWWYGLENRLVFLTTSRRDIHRGPLSVNNLRAHLDQMFPDFVESIWLENAQYPLYGWLLLFQADQVAFMLGDSPPIKLRVPPRSHSVWLKRPHFTYQY